MPPKLTGEKAQKSLEQHGDDEQQGHDEDQASDSEIDFHKLEASTASTNTSDGHAYRGSKLLTMPF